MSKNELRSSGFANGAGEQKLFQEKLKNFCELRVVNSFFSRYTFRDIVFADCEGTKARSNPISTLRIQKVQREQYEYFKRRTSVSRLWRQSHFP